MVRNVDRKSVIYTDESKLYVRTGEEFTKRDTVKHLAKKYARFEGETVIHTNTIENVFSVFRGGMAVSTNIAAESIFTVTLPNSIQV